MSSILAQDKVSFYVFDRSSKLPIENVHIFFENTTYGTVSNARGNVNIESPMNFEEDLYISHLAYDLRILPFQAFSNIKNNDTLYLHPNAIDLSAIVITTENKKKRKKYLKKFEEAFLGNTNEAKKCKIINPEVINFTEEEDGSLIATASDMIQIRNEYLGYEINYLLTMLSIESNGSVSYLGRSKFSDLFEAENKEIVKNREKTYQASLRHFLKSMIDDNLKKDKYRIHYATNELDYLKVIKELDRDEILAFDTVNHIYHLYFSDFLKVTNGKVKTFQTNMQAMQRNGLESSRFSTGDAGSRERMVPVISYLFKTSKALQVDKNGHVLNTKNLKEYGFWAGHKMALTLPYDYNLNIEEEINQVDNKESKEEASLFERLLYDDIIEKRRILGLLESSWKEHFIPLLVEYMHYAPDAIIRQEIGALLGKKTGHNYKEDYFEWLQWLWQSEPIYPSYYSNFKAALYKNLDPKFEAYFLNRQEGTKIRLDEIVWGGVKQDGIPPLRYPELLPADEADYLGANDIVFGVSINGIHKAYPKRILAWHEMVVDRFGDSDIAGVYCTLCGTVIAYDMMHKGGKHNLGTSGFLYRSNKLMYDKSTQSLWNTIEGQPVLGPLVNKDITLSTYPVVTTTWKDWKVKHPDTEVLSLETGHQRDYNEGAAYNSYFSTDELMFPVPQSDSRLKNKDLVYVLKMGKSQTDPIAISTNWLKRKKWLLTTVNDSHVIFLFTNGGAIRAYDIENYKFKKYKNHKLSDLENRKWEVREFALIGPAGEELKRLSGHEIFWFAWYNTYPETRLFK